MVDGETVAIDAEFACGPAGLDIAFLIAGYVFAFCAAGGRTADASGEWEVSCGDAVKAALARLRRRARRRAENGRGLRLPGLRAVAS